MTLRPPVRLIFSTVSDVGDETESPAIHAIPAEFDATAHSPARDVCTARSIANSPENVGSEDALPDPSRARVTVSLTRLERRAMESRKLSDNPLCRRYNIARPNPFPRIDRLRITSPVCLRPVWMVRTRSRILRDFHGAA